MFLQLCVEDLTDPVSEVLQNLRLLGAVQRQRVFVQGAERLDRDTDIRTSSSADVRSRPPHLLVRVLGLQPLLSRLVPELGEPADEQRVRAGRQDPFPTHPSRFRPDRKDDDDDDGAVTPAATSAVLALAAR